MTQPPTPLDPMALAFDGIQLVEASAGTGKTWLIAALYVRLVLGHGSPGIPLLPPQILVVTFTKAATAELRERIRTRLTEAAAVFRGAPSKDAFLHALLAAYPAGDPRDSAALRLELAAQWMDEAAIFTIHAWCQRMLTRHAFDSGRPFAQSAEADEQELLREACRDYWRRECYPLDASLFVPLQAAVSGPDALAGRVSPLLPKLDCMLEGGVPGPGSLADVLGPMVTARATQEAALRAEWAGHLDALDEALPALAACCSGTAWHPRHYSGWLQKLRAWSAGETDTPELTPSAWNRLTRDGMSKALKKGAALPEVSLWDATATLEAFYAAGPPITATVIQHAVPRLRRAIAEAKRRSAQIGFDDMLTQMTAALEGPSADAFARRLREDFPLAMIDEFQDTDPGQWRSFARVYAARGEDAGDEPRPAALLLIGDPKQAIYSFRGADIHTYFAARDTARAPALTLGRNYRSTQSMVAAVNALFDHGESRCNDGVFRYGPGEQGLAFHRVDAAGRDDRLLIDEVEPSAMTFACHPSAELLGKDVYCTAMAEACAAEIARLMRQSLQGKCRIDGGKHPRPLSASDIAVLVRNRREADRITEALRERGLACVYLSDAESVYAGAEATDLLLWLRAMADPGADRSLRAAMAAASFGLDFASLDRLSTDELYREQCIETFRTCQQVWRTGGVLAAVRRLLHAFAIPTRLFAAGRGERAVTNLLHLAELLQHAAVSLDGEHALLRHLGDEIDAARLGRNDGSDARVVRLESEDELIKVVTIHKSKGLEYPLVFLPFACTFRETKATDAVLEYRRHGQRIINLMQDPAACAQADLDRMREDARLLYVAVTRAQFACWIGIAAIGEGGHRNKQSAVGKSALGYLLGGGEPLMPAQLASQLGELQAAEQRIQVSFLPEFADRSRVHLRDGEQALRATRSVSASPRARWWITSYSALAHGATSDPESAAEAVLGEAPRNEAEAGTHVQHPPATGPIPSPMDAFPRGASAGTFLHYLLEWAAAVGFARAAAEPDLIRAEVERRCDASGFTAWAPLLIDWLPGFLATPLPLPGGTPVALAGLARGRYRPEFEFHLEARDLSVPALDRLVCNATFDAAARPQLKPRSAHGMLKGFIDLVFEHEGRWWVADYKSNHRPGPDRTPSYHQAALAHSILEHRYDLQYALYLLALQRFLRARLPDYDYDRDVGGAVYLYLRGIESCGEGVFTDRPPRAMIDALDALFAGTTVVTREPADAAA
jgi:exodeoxyribonuclease V beta subunit